MIFKDELNAVIDEQAGRIKRLEAACRLALDHLEHTNHLTVIETLVAALAPNPEASPGGVAAPVRAVVGREGQ